MDRIRVRYKILIKLRDSLGVRVKEVVRYNVDLESGLDVSCIVSYCMEHMRQMS